MIVTKLTLRNWGPYRGEHVLKLGPKTYAIVARMKEDAEASNLLGKSSLLEAIYFALTGDHRHRYDDGWISRGEQSGEVALEVSTGDRIVRTRDKKSGKLWLYRFGTIDPLMKAEAEDGIRALVGMNKADLKATSYFEQRQMARMILQEPGERVKTVSAWFRLEPLIRCEARVREKGEAREEAAKRAKISLEQLVARRAAIESKDENGEPRFSRETIAKLAAAHADRAGIALGRIARLEDELQQASALAADAANRETFDRLVVEGKEARAKVDAIDPKARIARLAAVVEVERAAAVKLAERRRDMDQKAELARGEFDGKCPVAGIECPARADINSSHKRNGDLYDLARDKARAAANEWSEGSVAAAAARSEVQEYERLQARLSSLREQAARAKPKGPAPETKVDFLVIRRKLDDARTEMQQERDSIARLKAMDAELGTIESSKAALEQHVADEEKLAGMPREAIAVFRAARRRVAEDALATIEEDANDTLRECGARLTVSVNWTREGKGLASACDACGNPYPTSTKVKNCTRCGAERGPKLEDKLEIGLSDRSGAGEDLAGIAVQLAAARWLREERGSAWATAMLDEPFGALDARHRKGLSRHLAVMLGKQFGQAFVIAHHAQVLDALPGRIEIVSEGGWSKARVIG